MDSLWVQLGLVALLVVVNAAFSGSEIALISLREGQLSRLEQDSRSGRVLAALARDPNRFLSTIQIGITLAGFLASATAAVTLSEPLVARLEPALGTVARPLSIFVVTLLLSFVTLVFGEIAPKRIALQRAERWALLAARPLARIAAISRPAVWLLGRSTDLVVRLLGGDPAQHREDVSEEDLRDMVATQAELTDQERAIIAGAFEVNDRTLRAVLVPRNAVVALPADLPAPDGVQRLLETGHSRAPVHRDDLDDVLGIVHLRALVGSSQPVSAHTLPAVVLPETATVLDSLRRLQDERQQMALVVNEHGGTEGIVTVEDFIEELVGEIWDEADPDVREAVRNDDGSVVVLGSFPVHDLPDLQIAVPQGDYSTVAGLVLAHLGHLPEPGETVTCDAYDLTVEAVEGTAITRVRIAPQPL